MSRNIDNSAHTAHRCGTRRLRSAASVLGVAWLVCCAIAFAPPLAAQEEFPASGASGATVPCPAPEPRLETCMGWSLYWHDPCGQGYNCQDPVLDHDSDRPHWFVMAEFMPLFRDTSAPLTLSSTGGDLHLETGALDSDFAAGGRLLAGLSLGDWYRLEFSGLSCYSWSDTAAAQDLDEYQSLSFSSELDDMQLNLRRRMAIRQNARYAVEMSTILGLRYMRIDENLDSFATLANPAATRQAAVEAENSMFGVQIGALAQFLARERGWIDFEIKGGIFSNEAQVNSTHITDGVPSVFAGKETRTAFLGDLSLMFNYQFAPAWTFRAGYNAMWLTGLALASGNTATGAALPQANVDREGNAVYHGPSISLIWAH